ncbi:MAG: hypothetical protein V1725_06850 [archaeon]
MSKNKIEHLLASVERIEKGDGVRRKIVLGCAYGEYSVDLSDVVARTLWVGDVLEVGFQMMPSKLTDFIGQKPEPNDVVTASLELTYLRVPGKEYVYKAKGYAPKK